MKQTELEDWQQSVLFYHEDDMIVLMLIIEFDDGVLIMVLEEFVMSAQSYCRNISNIQNVTLAVFDAIVWMHALIISSQV